MLKLPGESSKVGESFLSCLLDNLKTSSVSCNLFYFIVSQLEMCDLASFGQVLHSIKKHVEDYQTLTLPLLITRNTFFPSLHIGVPSKESQSRLPKEYLKRVYGTKTPPCLAVSRFAHYGPQSTTCRQGNHRSRSNVDDVRSAKSRVASSGGADQRVVRIHMTCRDIVICF